ncbi:MAG: DUF58 domain-containing protein [Proteobacteria bacterium]|nr:MAG: DUF58 domain-containing protein [Pseudomonadota bacterium]
MSTETADRTPVDRHARETLRLDSRKVYILPTRYGMLFAGALLLMLLVSVNYNNGLGHLFTFLLAGVGVVSMHYTQRNLTGLSLSMRAGRAVFAGEPAKAEVVIGDEMNRGRFGVYVRGGAEDVAVDIEAGGRASVELVFATERRGLLELPATRLVTIYPMGLFCAWTRNLPETRRQMVYPRPAQPTPLPCDSAGGGAGRGGRRRLGVDDFKGLRDHRRGDPFSRVHWRSSARGQGLKTKLFDGEGAEQIELKWTDTTGADDEARLSLLCRWVIDADSSGLRYALDMPGARIGHGSGRRHRQRCLETLALWTGPS